MNKNEFMNKHEVRMGELEKACENLNKILDSDTVEGFEDDNLDHSIESEREIQDIQTKNSQELDDLLKSLENL